MEVTIAIPTIPPRVDLLQRAVASAVKQHHPPAAISIAVDHHGEGAAATRNRAWRAARTEWVAFVDDDDELKPSHLEACARHQAETGADMVYPWFSLVGGASPFSDRFYTDPWDPERPRQTTVVMVVRRSVLEALGGFREMGEQAAADPQGNRVGEEYDLVLRMNAAGYRISHLVQKTWCWYHHDANTSGRPWRERLGEPC